MAIVAVSFVGWMVFEVGMDITGQGSASANDEIARVNGRKITGEQFYSAVRNAQEQQRQMGNIVYTLDAQRDLEDQVLEGLVQQIVIQEESRRRSISTTDEEVRQAMLNMPLPEMVQVPEFQTDGQFDLSKYQRYLMSQRQSPFVLALQSQYEAELPQRKLIERLAADVFFSDGKLWRLYKDRYDSVATKVMTILPQSAISDDEVEVTDADVSAYYESHRDDFLRPAMAHLSFISVSRIPDSADSTAALERATNIRVELGEGADFAELAARESADSGSRQQGGDLGEVRLGQHVAEFADVAMALRPGRISDPVLSDFGYHIIRLESKTDTSYHASHILIPVELQGDHLDEVESLGDSLDFHAAEQEDPATLDSTASMLSIPVMEADVLAKGNRLRLDNYIIPDVGIWAFEAFEGETSNVIETDQAYYVFRIDRLEEERTLSLDEVLDDAFFGAREEKKWEMAEQLAARVDEDLRGGTPFENAAVEHGLRPLTLEPFTRLTPNPALASEPEVVGVAFGLEIGQVSGPIQTERAIFFLEPTARTEADSSGFLEEMDQLRDLILQDARQIRVQLVIASLRESADFTDGREALRLAQRTQFRMPGASNPLGF
jgi:parvulin-like peptidyl-prolyl isomerase